MIARDLRRSSQGYTLIELLVVVLIVGILASIAIPQYFKVVEKSRIAEAMSLVSSIKSSEERYMANGGLYTANFNLLDIWYTNISESAIVLKYFSASLNTGSNTDGAPTYQMTLSRITNTTSVAPRYGLYNITVNVPMFPIPTISYCATGSTNCKELLN